LEGQDQLTLARNLVEALEAGERGQADRIVNALVHRLESSVCSQIATMTKGLRKALCDLEGDIGVAGMTLHEIPDVRE
jgi:chemotaxis protein CheZ